MFLCIKQVHTNKKAPVELNDIALSYNVKSYCKNLKNREACHDVIKYILRFYQILKCKSTYLRLGQSSWKFYIVGCTNSGLP